MTENPQPPDNATGTLDVPLLTLRALFLASAMGFGLYIARGVGDPEFGAPDDGGGYLG